MGWAKVKDSENDGRTGKGKLVLALLQGQGDGNEGKRNTGDVVRAGLKLAK